MKRSFTAIGRCLAAHSSDLLHAMDDLEWWSAGVDGIYQAKRDLRNYILHGISFLGKGNSVYIYLVEMKASHDIFTVAFDKQILNQEAA